MKSAVLVVALASALFGQQVGVLGQGGSFQHMAVQFASALDLGKCIETWPEPQWNAPIRLRPCDSANQHQIWTITSFATTAAPGFVR